MKKEKDIPSEPETTPITDEQPKPKKDYFTLRVPRLTFENTRINAFLVFCIVIFAFLLGMLTNKVIILEKQIKQTPTPAAQEANMPTTAPPPQIIDVSAGKLPLLGDPNAKVTVVEFSDFQCPFCKRAFDDAITELKKEYIDNNKIAFAYRHAPLISIHPNAKQAALASECANEQNNFWGYHDELFNTQEEWSQKSGDSATDAFVELAGNIGLDSEQFRTCLESEKYNDRVEADSNDSTTAQVDGTPTFFINGYRVVGAVPFEELQKVIEDELKK